jgi:hypothetical protein
MNRPLIAFAHSSKRNCIRLIILFIRDLNSLSGLSNNAEYRDGQLALQLALKTQDNETLAAAYAENGAFDQAVASQKSAFGTSGRWFRAKWRKGS